ncbi:Forkhead-associated (FHA) domain [Candidatus Nanopelagicaceae bacterium]
MNQPKSNSELTSTLHLGVRSVVDGSPESALNALLSSANELDLVALNAILDGPADRAMVVIHRGPARGARFLIDQNEVAIGRSTDSPVFLDDVTVSRKHAVIEGREGVFTLRDLGSLNGTYLNNQTVSESQLATGDEIQIGKFHLLFISKKN